MKQFKIPALSILLLLMNILFYSSCKKNDIQLKNDLSTQQKNLRSDVSLARPGFSENDMVMFWNEKAAIILDNPGTPPAQERYFAMIEIAVHDALNSVKPKYDRFALLNVHEQFASPDAAVASAAYWTIKNLGVQGSLPVDAWYAESLATIPDGDSKELGKTLGRLAADAIIANRVNDNFLQANTQLPAPDGIHPGEYRSTLPFSNPGFPKIKALQQWGTLMTPFVVQSNSQFRPAAPFAVNSVQYTADYNEVKAKGARAFNTRTADEDEIGRFWVERASISWNRFARNLVSRKKMDAWKTARLFALLHTAMTDGISGCFEAKYHYFFWRPETAIRFGDNDGNNNTTGDAGWLPSNTETPNPANAALNVNTPPMPDYPSAHANFGGAAAEILKLFFGTDAVSVDAVSTTTPGIVRHYSSISKAARDNSLSRIYVGYHFRNSCMAGEEQGKQIATYVFDHSFKETE